MKVVKSQVVLFMHEKLLLEGELNAREVKEKFELDDKKYYRYIQEIKSYYANMFKKDEIIYKRKDNKYYLKKND